MRDTPAMCNQPDCLHKNHIILSERDLRVAKAFAATLLMRIYAGSLDAQKAQHWSLLAGACAIDCNNPSCEVETVFADCLRHAVDHVDFGEPLVVTEMYNDLGLLEDGKKPRQRGAAAQVSGLFAGLLQSLMAPPSPDEPIVFIDAIAPDAPAPIHIDPTPSAQVELGRMVGPDRGKLSDAIDFFGDGDDSN